MPRKFIKFLTNKLLSENGYAYLFFIPPSLLLVTLCLTGLNRIHSDAASAVIYAFAAIDSGHIIPRDFYFSTEINVVGPQLFLIPIYALTKNAPLSYLLSICTTAILLISFTYWFLKRIHVSSKAAIISLGIFPLLFYSAKEVWSQFNGNTHTIFSTMFEDPIYGVYSLLFLIIIGLIISTIQNIEKPKWANHWYKILIVFAICWWAGIASLRLLMMYLCPLIVAYVIFEWFYKKDSFNKNNLLVYSYFAIMLIGTAAGQVIARFLSEKEMIHAANLVANPGWKNDDIVRAFLYNLLEAYKIYGYGKIKLASAFYVLTGFLLLFLTINAIVWGLKNKQNAMANIFAIFPIGVYFMIGYTNTFLDGTSNQYYYYDFLLNATIPIIALFIHHNLEQKKVRVLLLAILLVGSLVQVVFMIDGIKKDRNEAQKQLISELTKRNIKFGYSGFWTANVLTVLSNQKVIACVNNYKWLTRDSYFNSKKYCLDKYFIAATKPATNIPAGYVETFDIANYYSVYIYRKDPFYPNRCL